MSERIVYRIKNGEDRTVAQQQTSAIVRAVVADALYNLQNNSNPQTLYEAGLFEEFMGGHKGQSGTNIVDGIDRN